MKSKILFITAGVVLCSVVFFATARAIRAQDVSAPDAVTTSITASNDAENIVANSSDSPAMRVAKLARYWSLYREVGSDKVYAITTSGTKREVQTMAFFSAFEVNFGIKLMPKGSLDQFTAGDPIVSATGLNPADFRKAPQPCRLLKTADKPVVYLACLGIKRAIRNEKAFRQFGWDFKQVKTVNATEVEGLKEGESVAEDTVFEQGVQIDDATMSSELKEKKPMMERGDKATSTRSMTNSQRVIKAQGDSKIYLVGEDGKRHRLVNMEAIKARKVDLRKLQTLPAEEVNAIPEGETITPVSVNPVPTPEPVPESVESSPAPESVPESVPTDTTSTSPEAEI